MPFSPWDGLWSLCWCSPTGRHQEALKHLQEAFGHCPAEDFARARLAVLQLQSRNVAEAAAPLSTLARRDEKDLAFLLNFVDTKQQQHLAQVQPFFFDHTSVDSVGEELGRKTGLAGISPCLEKCVGRGLSDGQGTNWLFLQPGQGAGAKLLPLQWP